MALNAACRVFTAARQASHWAGRHRRLVSPPCRPRTAHRRQPLAPAALIDGGQEVEPSNAAPAAAQQGSQAPVPPAARSGGSAANSAAPAVQAAAAANGNVTQQPQQRDQGDVQHQQAAAGQAAAAADTAAAEAQAAAAAPAMPMPLWRRLVHLSWKKVQANLWALLVVHALADASVFMLHRVSHRLTNELAVRMLGGGALSPAAIGNMWWLSADPSIANFQTGYQLLTFVVFVLAFPINVMLKTFASAGTLLLCQEDAGKHITAPWWDAWAGTRAALPVVASLWSRVSRLWRQVFLVELVVAAAVVPLQFASLAVVTLPLTLPLILDLQAATASAVFEGQRGLDAIKRSRQLVKPMRWQLAVPFVGFVLAGRLADAAKGFVLTQMPPRFYRELVELPLAVLLGGTVLSVLFSRLQDVLPWAAYREAVKLESAGGAAAAQDGPARQQQGGKHKQGTSPAGGVAGPGGGEQREQAGGGKAGPHM